MTVGSIVDKLSLTVLTGQNLLDRKVTGGFVSDLLSNVMGQAVEGQVWITMQSHANVVAVASLVGLAAVIVVGDYELAEDVLTKADQENVIILKTNLPSFEVVGLLYDLGIKGI